MDFVYSFTLLACCYIILEIINHERFVLSGKLLFPAKLGTK